MFLEHPSSSSCVQEVLRLLKSSKVEYERAYDKTRNKGLHNLYGALASTHVPMIRELEQELAHCELLGPGTSRARKVFGGFLKEFKEPAWLMGEEGTLRLVHRTESSLLSVYDRHLLKLDLSSGVMEMLNRHRSQVLTNLKDIELFMEGTTTSLA